MNRPTFLLMLVFLALGATSASAASATDGVVSPEGTIVRLTKLERACAIALERFCPALAETPGQTRNQIICLKPYRSSLAPSCRGAVNAALK